MLEAVITSLIYLCIIAIAIYLVIWVLGQLGIAIPEPIMKIIWVIVILLAILFIARTILPKMGFRVSLEPAYASQVQK